MQATTPSLGLADSPNGYPTYSHGLSLYATHALYTVIWNLPGSTLSPSSPQSLRTISYLKVLVESWLGVPAPSSTSLQVPWSPKACDQTRRSPEGPIKIKAESELHRLLEFSFPFKQFKPLSMSFYFYPAWGYSHGRGATSFLAFVRQIHILFWYGWAWA